MTSLVPYLTFQDGDASLRFLVSGLGFEVVTAQQSADGGVLHAELRRGDAVVMGGEGPHRPTPTPGIYLVVNDPAPNSPLRSSSGSNPGTTPTRPTATATDLAPSTARRPGWIIITRTRLPEGVLPSHIHPLDDCQHSEPTSAAIAPTMSA
jgi:hypothetical protein